MERLRPLSEAECYARLYGQREPTVTVIGVEPRDDSWSFLTGETLRQAFEERLDLRDGLDALDVEAA
jgi:hypothetical protein